ncbi:MAG: CBS domain-containing protein [Firmicutes bacterium]|nr:CBS domain-containing protein [Bacillota bacterium]
MKVRDVYTKGAITIAPTTSIREAQRLMQEHKIRRLPVVDRDRLVGIVTQLDLMRATPSVATSLSVWEINYLLDKVQVGEIMTRNVMTVTPETDLVAAARLMIDRKIGGVPVVEGDRVVGIITESDIFRALVGILEGGQAGVATVPPAAASG